MGEHSTSHPSSLAPATCNEPNLSPFSHQVPYNTTSIISSYEAPVAKTNTLLSRAAIDSRPH